MKLAPGVARFGGLVALCVGVAVWVVWSHFNSAMALAAARAARASVVVDTRCGPIEYQEAGSGPALLMVHGSGGGHDQGMAFAGDLPRRGIRVIAMSRFGYLRTPMPADGSPAAQADAHVCLLDALGIRQAAVLGGSAGAPSAMQMAIRHPARVSALVLLVPLAYKPATVADSATPLPPAAEKMMLRLVGSDLLLWAALQVAPDQVIRFVLQTPPELVAAASAPERARVHAIADGILPVSARAAGLRSDSVLGKSLPPYPLESIRAPTLVVSTRDDGFGTYASAQYTAQRVPGARFLGYDHGGHLWVGHDAEVRAEIAKLVLALPPAPAANTSRLDLAQHARPAQAR
jgi:2-hydroxy-6-oxonona-2,4-dienedioate hydrolase